ncbi:MAG: DUF1622 domain-containing protein [Ignavibacteria bacterium]|nr:DUF1622 domain-containing protein [Ignavibacteria bacterium]
MNIIDILKDISFVIGLISFAIMAYGALLAIINLIRTEITRFSGKFNIERVSVIRRNFGNYLLLGLEFLIAADIIQTIITPTLEELAILGGIVVVRTVLNYFLNKEIENVKLLKSKSEVVPSSE